jgi:hypothetical protein
MDMWQLKQKMNDFKKIRRLGKQLFPEDLAVEFDKTTKFIRAELSKGGQCVVITHHAPSFRSVPEQFKNDIITNGAYASTLDELILDHENIVMWCHGHMHNTSYYFIGNILVLCNPRGYPKYVNPEFTLGRRTL